MMSKIPLVSVLMTAYNREKYIAEAIESVLASTFEDFELIIVDDCSKDRTVEIARQYESDPRVRVYLNEKNLGDYPNRNRAAELARGKYLKYVDADDIIYPHGLEVMVHSMEFFPNAGFGVAFPQINSMHYPVQLSPHDAYTEHFFYHGILSKAPLSTILSAKAFWASGGFSGKQYVGDSEMWLTMAARAPVVIMPNGLVWWRQHGEQQAQYELNNAAENESLRFRITMQALYASQCPLREECRTRAIAAVKRRHIRRILRLAFSKNLKLALGIYRESEMVLSDLRYTFTKI